MHGCHQADSRRGESQALQFASCRQALTELEPHCAALKTTPALASVLVLFLRCCCDAVLQPDGVGQLVLGTEDSRVLLLGPGCTAVSASIALPAVPAIISTSGGFDVGYRVTVAARDGWLYSIKGGTLSGSAIQLHSQPVALVSGCEDCAWGTCERTFARPDSNRAAEGLDDHA
jgi:hypothetical protein